MIETHMTCVTLLLGIVRPRDIILVPEKPSARKTCYPSTILICHRLHKQQTECASMVLIYLIATSATCIYFSANNDPS